MNTIIPPEVQLRLKSASAEGSRAFFDGYPITATVHRDGTPERTAFSVGWTRARDKAVAEGLALPGADNSTHPNSR